MKSSLSYLVLCIAFFSLSAFTSVEPPIRTQAITQHLDWSGQLKIYVDLVDKIEIKRTFSPTIRLETQVSQLTGTELSLEYSIKEGHFQADIFTLENDQLLITDPDVQHYIFVKGELQEANLSRTLYVPHYIEIIQD